MKNGAKRSVHVPTGKNFTADIDNQDNIDQYVKFSFLFRYQNYVVLISGSTALIFISIAQI